MKFVFAALALLAASACATEPDLTPKSGVPVAATTITYEYPSATGDPYYPIPRAENQALYKRYQALANEADNVHFVGRLATYRYYNMDQVVGQALAEFRRIQETVPLWTSPVNGKNHHADGELVVPDGARLLN